MSGFMSFLRKVLGAAFSESEPSKQEQLLALEQDNCSLAALVCKMRSLGHWRLAVQQAHFRGQLSRAEKVRARGEGGPAQQGEGVALASLAAAAVLVSGSKFSWERARAEPGEK